MIRKEFNTLLLSFWESPDYMTRCIHREDIVIGDAFAVVTLFLEMERKRLYCSIPSE